MSFLRYCLASSIGTALAVTLPFLPAIASESGPSSSSTQNTAETVDEPIAQDPSAEPTEDAIDESVESGESESGELESGELGEVDSSIPDADHSPDPELTEMPDSPDETIPVVTEAAEEELDAEIEEDPAMAPDHRPSLDPLVPDAVVVPEYVNPSANPLFYPTRPEEVEITETVGLSLEEAIELARRNSTTLQEALRNLEVSEANLRGSQAANLPTVDVQGSLTHQDTDDQAPPPAFGEEPDTITTNLGAALVVNYDIFTSGRRSSLIRAAEYTVRLQELQVEVITEQLRLDVTNAYYALQEADELVRIDRDALDQALESLDDAIALERAGVGTRFSVLEAQVDVANARQELLQSISDLQTARRELAAILNLSQVVNLQASDVIEVTDQWNLSLEESITLAFQNRAELEQQLLQRDISEQRRQVELAAIRPQVSAFARYDMNDLLDRTDTASDRETYQIGIQANLRLYDGGAARASARREELNMELAENAFTETRNQIRLQVERAYYDLQANFESIDTATLAVETAQEALRLARLRFQAGVETQTDVLLAQTDLTRAEVNRLRAVLGYNRSLAEMRRAVSNTPDNDLSDRP
jgi:outer membrane protein TolC